MGFGSLVAALGQWSDSFAPCSTFGIAPPLVLDFRYFLYRNRTAGGGPQNLLWWNPLFHSIEALREGFFLGYQSPVSELWVPYLAALVFYLLSLPITRFVEQTRRARHRL